MVLTAFQAAALRAWRPDRHLGAEPADSWIGWEGLFAIEAIYLVKQVVIVARHAGPEPRT